MDKPATAPKLVKVRIYQPHKHAGVKHNPGPDGLEIEVPEHDAKFLKDIGALEKPVDAKPTTAAPAATP